LLVHSPSYVSLVRKELSNLRGPTDLSTGDTVISPGSFDAAQFAAGGVLNAVDAVMTEKVKNAFCAVRPPATTPPQRAAWASAFTTTWRSQRDMSKRRMG